MKKIFQYLIPGFVFLILLGCEFEDPTIEGPSPLITSAAADMAMQILQFKKADTDLYISLSYSNQAIAPEYGLFGTPFLMATGFNSANDCLGELVFGQHRIPCDVENAQAGMELYPQISDETLFQYLGQEVEISFSNSAYRLAESGKATLIVPKPIQITSPVLNLNGRTGPALRPGLPLRWQASPRGGQMVIIASDTHTIKRQIIEGQPRIVTINHAVVDDNGSYILGADLLKDFPRGERVTLHFLRVSFTVEDISSNRGTEKVKLYAYTQSTYTGILE